MVGAIFSHSQPDLSHLLKEGNIKQVEVIVPANIDPSAYLERTVCKELDHLPLDDPSALVQERDVFKGVSLDFHFNRKYPLVRHIVSWKDERDENEGEKQLEVNGHTEKQQACKNGSSIEVDQGDNDIENNVLMQIKPSPSAEYPSVLVTGKTPIARIAKIHNYRTESLSVFIVPHQESKECLSLLPEDVRKQLSNPTSLKNAALHLALYHKRKSFRPSLDKLKGTKLEEKGKSFSKYYLRVCKPEADLKVMLQDPEAKLSPFLYNENVQLNWYKKQKLGAFSELEKVVSEEEGKQYKRMVFFRDSLAWADFYKHIHAEVYVMSAEDLKNEPRLEVLNGIILANIQRKTKCSIVITDRLPWSLDQIIQRDVRKLAFPDGNSEPIVRVGFLDKNSHKSAKSIPFFTINPWSQAQCYKSQHHIVSVNTSKHTVSGIGVEPRMHLIRDEMDIMEEISTKDSNEVIGHITHSHTPPSKACFSESTRLETYLKLIGHKVTYTSYGVDDVLDCLIGNSLVQQLKDIASSKDVPHMEIVPVLLKQKAVGSSICILTPTKSAASEADIDVYISRNKCLQVGDKKVQSAKFIVRRARTMTVDITLKVSVDSKPLSLKLTKYLDLRGSCGQTVANHIHSICCKEDAWIHARERTVGEVLYIFLREEKALLAIQSLPLFLSFPIQSAISFNLAYADLYHTFIARDLTWMESFFLLMKIGASSNE